MRQLPADSGGEELDDQRQHHQPPDEGADHRPAAAVQALHQRRADTARADDTQSGSVLQVDIEAVNGGGNEARRQLRDDAVADFLKGVAAHGVQTFQNVGVQIFNGCNVHFGDHADRADGLGDDTAGRAGSGNANPHQCPHQTGNGADQQDQQPEQVGNGLRHDVGRSQKSKGNRQNRAEQGAQHRNGYGLQQQIRDIRIPSAEQQLGIGIEDAVEDALCHFGACCGHAVELDAGGRPADHYHDNQHDQGVEHPLPGTVGIGLGSGKLPVVDFLKGFQFGSCRHVHPPLSSASCAGRR